jgi:hypothetical protein
MTPVSSLHLERALAATLYWGTWMASSVVAVGLTLPLLDSRAVLAGTAVGRDMRITTAGIALLISLPIIRVVVMLFAFLCEPDYRFSTIAALVLTIILLGLFVGRHTRQITWSPPTSLFRNAAGQPS